MKMLFEVTSTSFVLLTSNFSSLAFAQISYYLGLTASSEIGCIFCQEKQAMI